MTLEDKPKHVRTIAPWRQEALSKMYTLTEKHDRYIARLANRIQAIESYLGMSVLNGDSTQIIRKGHAKTTPHPENCACPKCRGLDPKQLKKIPRVDTRSEVEDDYDWEPPLKALKNGKIRPIKADGRTKRVYTDDERKAIGVRLQTARAAKLGLTYDELKILKLRPGQKPTSEQLTQLRKTARRKKTADPVQETEEAPESAPSRSLKRVPRRKS